MTKSIYAVGLRLSGRGYIVWLSQSDTDNKWYRQTVRLGTFDRSIAEEKIQQILKSGIYGTDKIAFSCPEHGKILAVTVCRMCRQSYGFRRMNSPEGPRPQKAKRDYKRKVANGALNAKTLGDVPTFEEIERSFV